MEAQEAPHESPWRSRPLVRQDATARLATLRVVCERVPGRPPRLTRARLRRVLQSCLTERSSAMSTQFDAIYLHNRIGSTLAHCPGAIEPERSQNSVSRRAVSAGRRLTARMRPRPSRPTTSNTLSGPGECCVAYLDHAARLPSGHSRLGPSPRAQRADVCRVARGFQLQLGLKTGKRIKFDGFEREVRAAPMRQLSQWHQDHERLSNRLQHELSVQLESREITVRGWNWGKVDVQGASSGRASLL